MVSEVAHNESLVIGERLIEIFNALLKLQNLNGLVDDPSCHTLYDSEELIFAFGLFEAQDVTVDPIVCLLHLLLSVFGARANFRQLIKVFDEPQHFILKSLLVIGWLVNDVGARAVVRPDVLGVSLD